jgi:two-component system cell cycle response regulator
MADKLRVLVVDDSKVIRKAFARILGEEYDLVEAEDGEQAWDILREDEDVCAVFTDMNMPHLDGKGLLQRIRSAPDEELKNIPVILVTAAEDGADNTKSVLQAGATDYILKPFDSVFLQSKAKAYVKPRDKAAGVDSGETPLAAMDPVTRLANRTFFMERGEQEMSAAGRRKSELALILIALDDFKKLTDGAEGKLVRGLVRKLGSYLSSEVRLEDTVARLEKDKFAILLSEANLNNATEMAERLRQKVNQKTIRHKDQSFKISISICVSALPPDIKRTFDMLMMDADRRLQEAIKQGGNKVMPEPSAAAIEQARNVHGIPSLDEAIAMLSRRGEEKLTESQAKDAVRNLLPLLDYCNDLLGLGMGEKLKELRKKYP